MTMPPCQIAKMAASTTRAQVGGDHDPHLRQPVHQRAGQRGQARRLATGMDLACTSDGPPVYLTEILA